jgi:hypothetical protein
MSDTAKDGWGLARDGKYYPPKETPDPPQFGADGSGWSTATVVTLVGVVVTAFLSLGALGASILIAVRQDNTQQRIADAQNTLQKKIADASRQAAAPRTKVDFVSSTVDSTHQVVTLVVSIQDVGQVTGYDCTISDTETIASRPAPAVPEQAEGALALVGGNKGTGVKLEPGDPHTVTLRYRRHADGVISFYISAICGSQDETNIPLAVQVLSANGALGTEIVPFTPKAT